MRRLHLPVVEHNLLLEWPDEGQIGNGARIVLAVRAGMGDCFRVVEKSREVEVYTGA